MIEQESVWESSDDWRKGDKAMNIVYASNDGYVRHLAASMCSMLEKNRQCPDIQVYILSMDLSGDSVKKLRQLAGSYGRELAVTEMGDLRERFQGPVDTGGYDLSIMARLFMGEVLPQHVDRVIYLDCDTIVAQSLEKLWDTKLEGHILGAVMEPTIYREVKESVGLGPAEPYYNSGVLLVDLALWRREKVQGRLLDFWTQKEGKLFASDQDVLNGVLRGRIKPLPPRYNFFTNYRYFSYEDLARRSPSYRAVTEDMFTSAKRHPSVIHYMGDERPWLRGNLNHYRRAYDMYLEKTPWAGTPREKGSELYMLAYHMLDYVTVLYPEIRWLISRHFGMKLVESRKKGDRQIS